MPVSAYLDLSSGEYTNEFPNLPCWSRVDQFWAIHAKICSIKDDNGELPLHWRREAKGETHQDLRIRQKKKEKSINMAHSPKQLWEVYVEQQLGLQRPAELVASGIFKASILEFFDARFSGLNA